MAGWRASPIGTTVDALGADGAAWRRLLGPLVDSVDAVAEVTSSTLVRWPRHPLVLAQLGLRALEQGSPAWSSRFSGQVAPALLTGAIAHANRALPDLASAAAGLVLATHGHAAGWPVPMGGSQSIIEAMAADFVAHGGEIVTGTRVERLADLPSSTVRILDVTPRALLSMSNDALPRGYARRLERFAYGSAVAKVDFALSAPVPWTNPELAGAVTLHLGGTRAETVAAERAVASGALPDAPYVLVSQPSVVDSSRAPAGSSVLWAYTHVPAGSTADRTEAITAVIERFAPGFRDTVLASASSTAVEVEGHNANYVGGDIASGDVSFAQLLRRPVVIDPWRTPLHGVYLASASVSPGPGVHGLGGWNAARRALAREFGQRELPDLGVGATS
jgi:phytoene dehydrogenase-like protein